MCDYKGGSLGDWIDSTGTLVDDEEEIRESLELLLKSENFSVDTAANGVAHTGQKRLPAGAW